MRGHRRVVPGRRPRTSLSRPRRLHDREAKRWGEVRQPEVRFARRTRSSRRCNARVWTRAKGKRLGRCQRKRIRALHAKAANCRRDHLHKWNRAGVDRASEHTGLCVTAIKTVHRHSEDGSTAKPTVKVPINRTRCDREEQAPKPKPMNGSIFSRGHDLGGSAGRASGLPTEERAVRSSPQRRPTSETRGERQPQLALRARGTQRQKQENQTG